MTVFFEHFIRRIQETKRDVDQWFSCHPSVRDVLWWSLPAVFVGLIIRCLILDYNPCAYWSKDSYSFMDFSYKLVAFGDRDMEAKRRWTYPILLLLSHLWPGGCLRAVALGQHAFGLLTILPMAWIVRKVFASWKWLLIPVTLFLSTHPGYLWYEHCVLAESLFTYFSIWAMAGWVTWIGCNRRTGFQIQGTAAWFWVFFIPFALMMLMKPSGRFFWPGLILGLVLAKAWRSMDWKHGLALLMLVCITPTMGTDGQGLRLAYTTLFPATNLESSKNSEYKEAVKDLVLEKREDIHSYYSQDKDIKSFLEYPAKDPLGGPLWASLEGKQREIKEKRFQLYKELSMEALAYKPWIPFYVAFQRIFSSTKEPYSALRWSEDFQTNRIFQDYNYEILLRKYPGLLQQLYGIRPGEPLPDIQFFARSISPKSDFTFGNWMVGYGSWHRKTTFLVQWDPLENSMSKPIYRFRPSLLGLIFLVGLISSLASVKYRWSVGVWNCMFWGYLFGVFAVGSNIARYFVPYEFMIALTLAVAVDVGIQGISKIMESRLFKKPI